MTETTSVRPYPRSVVRPLHGPQGKKARSTTEGVMGRNITTKSTPISTSTDTAARGRAAGRVGLPSNTPVETDSATTSASHKGSTENAADSPAASTTNDPAANNTVATGCAARARQLPAEQQRASRGGIPRAKTENEEPRKWPLDAVVRAPACDGKGGGFELRFFQKFSRQ